MTSLTPLTADQAYAHARQRHEQGQQEAAAVILQAVLGQAPDHLPSLSLLAAITLQEGDPCAAEGLLRQAQAAGGDNAVLWCNLGTALMDQARNDEALDAYAESCRRDAAFALPWYNRGNLLGAAQRFAEAAVAYREALARSPGEARIWNNLGNVYLSLGDFRQSEECYAAAIASDPQDPIAIASRANLHTAMGNYDAAEAAYRAVLPTIANSEGARFNLALNLFRQGRYDEAFPLYEHRWQGCPDLLGQYRYPLELQWRGEALAGRRILLWSEQGLGDALQFSRFVPAVVARGARVTLVVHPALLALFAASFAEVSVVSREQELSFADFDFHCPLMSLWLALAAPELPRLEQTPAPRAYLRAPAVLRAAWRARVEQGEAGLPPARLRVGLCWKSGKGMEHQLRSLNLAELAELAAPDLSFYRLLKPEAFRAEEPLPAVWQGGGPGGGQMLGQWHDLAADFTDLASTAALIEALDVVVSVDTAILHLAAALGKRVFGLFPHVGGNFFPQGRSDSPWYPGLSVIRQSGPGSWATAVATVAHALQQFTPPIAPAENMEYL